ncbi:hypothetical protein JCM17960_18590 [Magnetospira thiophila]
MIGDLVFEPLLPWVGWGGLCALSVMALAWSLWRRARGTLWRSTVLVLLLLALAGPRAQWQERQPEPDIGLLLIDRSSSQSLEQRTAQTDAAVAALRHATENLNDLDLREIEVGDDPDGGGTGLVAALQRAMIDLPRERFAGAILISDGQDRGTPSPDALDLPGPVHLLLTGHPQARDRRVEILTAPTFGMVGKTVPLSFQVSDPGAARREDLTVDLRLDGELWKQMPVRVGDAATVEVPLSHAGPTVVEVRAPSLPEEVSLLNNRAARAVTGVRDRLQVLLVSGRPHPGERVWRNLLKSDPGVDLVHFTILRPASRVDPTPLRELALISFPTQELFEERLQDFDLVIFDRYVVRHLMAPEYYRNIVDYVHRGGAFLLAAGPEFAGPDSPAQTDLGALLPTGAEASRVREQTFRPQATDKGRRHPVTLPLVDAPIGQWHQMIATDVQRGDVLMQGPDDLPLLILDRQGEGRVALLLSDQVWLWARGHDGGGPHGELLRRLIHWLMKEPELEEERLTARMDQGELKIQRRSLSEDNPAPALVTAPDGTVQEIPLKPSAPGLFQAALAAPLPGTYQVQSDHLTALAIGRETPEFSAPRSTPDKLAPLVTASGGAVVVLDRDGIPAVQRRSAGGAQQGRSWIGLQRNGVSRVTGARDLPLLPGLLFALALVGGLGAAWWREGR